MKVDPNRWKDKVLWEVYGDTGVYVRAQTPDGKWESVDTVSYTHLTLPTKA